MSSDGLELTFERAGSQLVVHLEGDLDVASAPRLVDDVLRTRDDETEVVVDASALHFSDAAGVHALMVIARRLADAGCETVIRQPTDRLLLIIDLTDLRTVVDLRPTADVPEPENEVRSAAAVAPDDQPPTQH